MSSDLADPLGAASPWARPLTTEPASTESLRDLLRTVLSSTAGCSVTRARASVVWAAAFVVAASAATWLVTLREMTGMDAGPGTDLGALSAFVAFWVAMMAAMMLPSELPMIAVYSRAARGRPLDTIAFVVGYLAMWVVYGLAAYGIYWLLQTTAGGFLAWNQHGPLVAGAALAATGLYQLTPLKLSCLRHCRKPLEFILGRWRAGPLGGLWMGGTHGVYCVACCFGLMFALFVLGVMSVFWMALLAAAMFVEKVVPGGERVARTLALLLVVLGVWIAVAPGTVPHLTQPGTMHMKM